MQRFVQYLAILIALVASSTNSSADEIWTYKFIVNGSRPYYQECGECSYKYLNTYADIAGSFSILLNWQNGTGKLFQLNDHLTNIAYGTYSPSTGMVITPANLPEADYGILPPESGPLPSGNFGWLNNVGTMISDKATTWPVEYVITFTGQSAILKMGFSPDAGVGVNVNNVTAVFASATIAGDYNGDGKVDASDYVVLRNRGGSPTDYQLWRTYFGTVTTPLKGAGVPEPTAAILILSVSFTLLSIRSRRFAI